VHHHILKTGYVKFSDAERGEALEKVAMTGKKGVRETDQF
jgi:hypothetical protein